MSTNNTPNWGGPGIGHRIEEAVELIEMELRHAIAYVNDAVIPQVRTTPSASTIPRSVIPQVRRESISAMRTAADTLRTLADRFEQRSGAAPGPRSTATEDGPPKAQGEPRS